MSASSKDLFDFVIFYCQLNSLNSLRWTVNGKLLTAITSPSLPRQTEAVAEPLY